PGELGAARTFVLASLKPIENFWSLTQTLVAFVLSFFLSQTYAVWRDAYSIARKVQGRLSDQGLILATNAEREDHLPNRPYTRRAVETVETWARYARLFNMLFFASVTRRFAPLATPKGLQALQAQGAVMAIEDGYLLAKLVCDDVYEMDEALRLYFETRQPRTSKVQTASRANAKLFHKRTPLSRAMTYGPIWLAGKIAPGAIRSQQDPFYAYDVREEPLR
ncbi:MAG: hypothetical protein AAF742_06170, partial [Pseudomonadota bacterium]